MQHRVRSCFGMIALISALSLAACSSDDGTSPATDGTDGTEDASATDGADDASSDAGTASTRSAKYLQLRDEPDELPSLECDNDNFPGADIDSVVLYSSPSLATVKGYLAGCEWMPRGDACENNLGSKTSGAEGKKDGNAFEGFTSLNGGVLMCQWSDAAELELGNIINIIEVGPEGQLERFQVRACKDAEGTDCGDWQTGTLSQLTFPAGTILPDE